MASTKETALESAQQKTPAELALDEALKKVEQRRITVADLERRLAESVEAERQATEREKAADLDTPAHEEALNQLAKATPKRKALDGRLEEARAALAAAEEKHAAAQKGLNRERCEQLVAGFNERSDRLTAAFEDLWRSAFRELIEMQEELRAARALVGPDAFRYPLRPWAECAPGLEVHFASRLLRNRADAASTLFERGLTDEALRVVLGKDG